MDRVILHCDMNSFYASVELLEHPELKDRPVAVSGDPEGRHGIILAKNEPAKKMGVKTAETIWQARKKCPELVLIRPHHEKYAHYSKLLNRIYLSYTDMVEPFSVDESWLDVTASQGLFGSGREIADSIRERVKEELGLTLSVGVSYNKIFAKMGSEYKKPDATTEITRENYKDLLYSMDVGEMFFVGFATAEKLRELGIATIGDLAEADPEALEKVLGKQGPLLRTYARGEDESPVSLYDQREKIKSVGNGITYKRDLRGEEDIRTAITNLSDTVAGRLRKYGMKAYGVKVDIKDPNFRTISRQTQLVRPTNLAEEIRDAAMDIMKEAWNMSAPVRMLTVTGINLAEEESEEQIDLFGLIDLGGESIGSDASQSAHFRSKEKTESIERTMDEIRDKFGDSSIGFGSYINSDIGIDL